MIYIQYLDVLELDLGDRESEPVFAWTSNVFDLEEISERKDSMMDKTNAEEKAEGVSLNKRKREIKCRLDLDLG
jgi:hypothetical protein